MRKAAWELQVSQGIQLWFMNWPSTVIMPATACIHSNKFPASSLAACFTPVYWYHSLNKSSTSITVIAFGTAGDVVWGRVVEPGLGIKGFWEDLGRRAELMLMPRWISPDASYSFSFSHVSEKEKVVRSLQMWPKWILPAGLSQLYIFTSEILISFVQFLIAFFLVLF